MAIGDIGGGLDIGNVADGVLHNFSDHGLFSDFVVDASLAFPSDAYDHDCVVLDRGYALFSSVERTIGDANFHL